MGVQVAWRHRVSRAERVTYRLGALGFVCMMVLAMDYDYSSAGPILFLYCYVWVIAVAVVGLIHQGLTSRRSLVDSEDAKHPEDS